MFNQNGLSLDQAPPISVVFRFFLLGALFGILSGLSLFFYGNTIFDTSSVGARTLTHLLTLGVMLSFMFAALFQMLPVIAGIRLSSPIKKANILLYPFIIGLFSLLLAFNTSFSWLYLFAGLLLGLALMVTIIPMLSQLFTLSHHTSSSKGMRYALIALGMLVLLGLYLLLSLGGMIEGEFYSNIKVMHYSFGLFGWIALLILSISFQVIEMFYVTPPYPTLLTKYWTHFLIGLLGVTSLISIFLPQVWSISHSLLALLLSSYALITLRRLSQKKRPLSDATVWFWRLGLTLLLLSMVCMTLDTFTHVALVKPLSYIFFAFFALSIVFAMFYKIVPFLTWFHLSSQGYFTAPMMHEVIHPQAAMKHLYIHLTTLVTFVLSLFISPFIFAAGILTIFSFGWMAWQMIHAWKLYNHTQETGEKFEMGNMS